MNLAELGVCPRNFKHAVSGHRSTGMLALDASTQVLDNSQQLLPLMRPNSNRGYLSTVASM